MKEFNYVYVITNLINGKQYVGDHSTNNMEDGYLGSGRPYFERAKKKYGKENFERKILEFFDLKEEAFEAQEKYINEYKTLSPDGYNISPKGGHNVHGCWSEESKKRMSELKKGTIHSEETKNKIGKALRGKKHTKETIENRKRRNKKYTKITSEETKKKISKSMKNRKLSDEHKKRISEGMKNRNKKPR